MSEPHDVTSPYVRPAVLRLDFAIDLPVSLAANCKTTQTTGSGTTPCSNPGVHGAPCRSAGS